MSLTDFSPNDSLPLLDRPSTMYTHSLSVDRFPQLHSQRVSQKAIIATRLPVELLGEIFKLYLDWPEWDLSTGASRIDNDIPRPEVCHNSQNCNSPLILGRICSYWRGVAKSTPSLWSTIVLSSPRSRQIPLITTWLERARRRPLTIVLTQRPSSKVQAPVELDKVMRTLIQFLPQWKKVVFWFREYYPHPLLDLDTRYLLRLESVLLRWNHGHHGLSKIWSLFYQSPLLREVRWTQRPPRWNRVPWGQLILIHCYVPISSDLFWVILTTCTHLETLEVKIARPQNNRNPVLPETSMVTHRNLRSPLIHFWTSSTSFYDNLTLPSLVDLYAVHQYDYPLHDAAEHALFDLIVRSSCSLRTFNFEYYRVQEDVMLAILRLPHLRNLSALRLTRVTDAILSFHNITKTHPLIAYNPSLTSSHSFHIKVIQKEQPCPIYCPQDYPCFAIFTLQPKLLLISLSPRMFSKMDKFVM